MTKLPPELAAAFCCCVSGYWKRFSNASTSESLILSIKGDLRIAVFRLLTALKK
jgi:hypothetical protein